MSRDDREFRLMELVGQIEDKYLEEAEYTKEEQLRLAARGGRTAVVQADSDAEDTSDVSPVEENTKTSEEEAPVLRANDGNRVVMITRVAVGVILAAAAVLLFVFLWNPNRGHDVVSTTESSEQSTEEEVETTEVTTEAPTETSAETILIDEEHFPDAKFRNVIAEKFDRDEDGKLNDFEILRVTEIFVVDGGIHSLQGIEYFPDLQSLSCTNNPLKTLDLSHNPKLKILYCGGDELTELDVSANPDLQSLDCSGNFLETLDVSKNAKLEMLLCYSNLLTKLDVSQNEALTYLHCYQNKLTSLDISSNLHMESFLCDEEVAITRP